MITISSNQVQAPLGACFSSSDLTDKPVGIPLDYFQRELPVAIPDDFVGSLFASCHPPHLNLTKLKELNTKLKLCQ